MGAKTWLLMYADGDPADILRSGPTLDREASAALLPQLFPGARFIAEGDDNLCFACPRGDDVLVGCFPGLTIIAAGELAIDYPSQTDRRFLDFALGRTVYIHLMHSVVDWFAYAVWKDGQWLRSLSVSPDSGIMEDIGERRAFEIPFWSGERPAVDPEEDPDDYPLPFHPLDMGEAALEDLFGYRVEGEINPALLDPQTIPLLAFKAVKKPWWKLW